MILVELAERGFSLPPEGLDHNHQTTAELDISPPLAVSRETHRTALFEPLIFFPFE